MTRFNVSCWFVLLVFLTQTRVTAQSLVNTPENPANLLSLSGLLPEMHQWLDPSMPLIGQISLAACQAGEIALEPVTLIIPEDALPEAHTVSIQYHSGLAPNAKLPEDVINLSFAGGHAKMAPSDIYHEGQLILHLKVAQSEIPAWGNAYDIVGLQYTPNKGWSQVHLHQWDEEHQIATFLTDPFAEFIAGIIQNPEVSPTAAFTNTQITDYKTPPPHDGITMMKPPSPNNMGTAALSYPIEIPPGRAGMQPQLSMNYNSDGGNGWMGLGWDLSVPSITIDTRWGVPRYDLDFETETYLYKGQMLYPVTHRGEWIAREAERVFHPRIEGDFPTIIRHGTRPDNYWWEIVETNGKRSYFGARSDGIASPSLQLQTPEGNTCTWFLAEQRDPNGNFVSYHYTIQEDNGPNGQMSTGYNRYLDEIRYTDHLSTEGAYHVRFIRDQQLEEPRRVDAYQNGSMGFKKVVASLLRKIEVLYREEKIRSYDLRYREGVFGKALLQGIDQYDANGNLFYGHDFQYFDDTRQADTFRPLFAPTEATVPGDNLKGKLTASAFGYPNETSTIGGNRAGNFSIGIAVTVGAPGSTLFKKNTGGGHYTFSQTKGYGINTLIDLNGDGRPDKVFVEDGMLFIRFNLGHEGGTIEFGEKKRILGSEDIKQISTSKTRSHSFGGEANLKATSFAAYVSKSKTKTKTTTPIYFQDFNADGLLDLAYNGRVFFNRLNEEGVPTFWATSSGTPNPISAGEDISSALAFRQDEDEEGQLTFEEENPLHDAVRVWVIPYENNEANIVVHGTVRLQQDNSMEAQSYVDKDGVKVSIEYEGLNTPLWNGVTIDPLDESIYQFHRTITSFDKGDMIFFRTHSLYDGAYDQTIWDIQIDFVDEETNEVLTHYDANGKNVYSYNSREDFHLVAPQEMGIPMNGQVRLVGDFDIESLTDTVHMLIEKREDLDLEDGTDSIRVIWKRTILPGQAVDDNFSIDTFVNGGDRLAFCAVANSNVDWQKLDWNPIIEYNYIVEEDGNIVGFRDTAGVSMFRQCAAVDMRMFNNVEEEEPYFIILPENEDATVTITYAIDLGPDSPDETYFGEGILYLSMKGRNHYYASTAIASPETPFPNPYTFTSFIPYTERSGDTLYIDVHFSDEEMSAHFQENYRPTIRVNGNIIKNQYQPNRHFNIYTPTLRDLTPLGTFYRNWGQFSYNGEGESGSSLIDANLVRDALIDYRENQVGDFDNDNPDEIQDALDPTRKPVGIMYANKDSVVWQGYDNFLYITDSIVSSSRLGEDNRVFTIDSDDGGEGLSAPIKVSRVESTAKSGGLTFNLPVPGVPAGNASAMSSTTRTWQHLEMMDVNLDRYPDIIANGRTQLTDPRGARTNEIIIHDAYTHYATAEKEGFTGGGSIQQAIVPNVASVSSNVTFPQNNNNASLNLSLGAQATIGLSQVVDHNEDETDSSWQDINGDGLPDIVTKEGTVRFNYGDYFDEPENWYNIEVRKGESTTEAASASLTGFFETNKVNGSWTLGVSVSKSNNHSTYGLQDITGDGIADILTVDENGDLYAQINLGQQYTEPILWQSDFLLDEGVSVSESINGAFNICINFFFVRVCINPKGYVGRSVSSPLTKITDLNGDGYPDLLRSNKDDNLVYHMSTIGRSNKLQSVIGPLGATMALDYELLPGTFEQGGSRWVLSNVEINDGYVHDGANIQKKTFEYEGGFKNRRERDFYGFAKVVSKELDTEDEDNLYRTKIQQYANDTYYRKGLILADSLMDSQRNLYLTTAYEYEFRDPLASAVVVLPDDHDADDGLAYPALRRTTKSYYEGQAEAGVIHTTRYDYDLKGNTTRYIDEGNGSPDDVVEAIISYHSLPQPGIYAIPRDLQVIDSNGDVLRHRNCEVNNTTGNVETIRQFYSPAEAAVFEYAYDEHGNIIKVTRPRNLNGERMTYEFTYDDELKTYVVGTSDAYGYSSSAAYDYRFGVPLSTTDLNDNEMVYAYDAKGRLTHLTGPYELANNKEYTIKMEYEPNADTPYSICRHYNEDTDSDILTVTFVDGLGRPIQVKKSGLLYQSSSQPDREVMNVSGKVIYDAFGREIITYYPISESMANMTIINTDEDTETPTVITYDVLDRKLTTILSDGAETSVTYDLVAPPDEDTKAFTTFTEDALENRTEVYSDVRGRQLATAAYGPDGPITTSFTYNPIAEMLTVTDVADNTTTFTYDMLGRQTSINHPVSGLTELYYDPVGNITKRLTANLRDFFGEDSGILYNYEYERPKSIIYPLNYQNKVEYEYGSPTDTIFNRRGKVILQRDASGAQEFFYGPMGEIVKTIRTVVINPTEIRTYVSEARYDSWNRVQQLFYPDGEIVDYDYNAAGKLSGLSGLRLGESYAYVDRISYDKFEKRRYLRLGNGTEQEYTYDPKRQWLSNMTARTGGSVFMNVNYTYDAVANILTVSNTQESLEEEMGGAYVHNYSYDELYRIYAADGTWTRGNREEFYMLDMEYDNTHSILSKNQIRTRNGQPIFNEANYFQEYEYNEGRAFVPSTVGRFHYDYDLNGNLLSVTDTTSLNLKEYEWDEENRLTAVIENGYVSKYTYDANGDRVIKSHGTITGQSFNGSDNGFIDHRGNYTAYISPNFVTRQGTYTKHYFVEGQRICSKIGVGQFNNNTAAFGQGTLTAGNIDYTIWLAQVRANELEYYGDSLTVSHPATPFRYVVPDSTGEEYPDLLPDTIVVTTQQGTFYILPDRPDLSGNSQARHPAWDDRNSTVVDSVQAGYGMTDTIGLPPEVLQYFYHSDHVGSTGYITDRTGLITQFAVYTAFGELFVEDQILDVDDSQPYLFNGKELDRETGLYYYGARYYEPTSSIWLSVDPLANKYPGWSPYNYTMFNPVRLVDPDGRQTNDPNVSEWSLTNFSLTDKTSVGVTDYSISSVVAQNLSENDLSGGDALLGLRYSSADYSVTNNLDDVQSNYGVSFFSGELSGGVKEGYDVGFSAIASIAEANSSINSAFTWHEFSGDISLDFKVFAGGGGAEFKAGKKGFKFGLATLFGASVGVSWENLTFTYKPLTPKGMKERDQVLSRGYLRGTGRRF